jgi:hypothetical protein
VTTPATAPPRSSPAAAEALRSLRLPSLDGLTEQQVRGLACVWDGVPFEDDEQAVDLGPRRKRHLGREWEWHPRGCALCVTVQALAALYEHVDECGECSTADALCPAGRQLYRLSIHGGRR